MTQSNIGGFDQFIEIDQGLLASIAKATFKPIAGKTELSDATFAASVTFKVEFEDLWLTVRDKKWVPAKLGHLDEVVTPAKWVSESKPVVRNARTIATITLRVSLEIRVAKTVDEQGHEVVFIHDPDDEKYDPVGADLATIKVDGYVDVTGALFAKRLPIRTDRDRPELTQNVWCAVLGFQKNQINFPQIDVVIDHERVRNNFLLQLRYKLRDRTVGRTAAENELGATIAMIKLKIHESVRDAVMVLDDWRHDNPGVVVLYAATDTSGDPAAAIPVTRLEVAAFTRAERPGSSLQIGLHTVSEGGALVFVSKSQLTQRSDMVVTVSHGELIGERLRRGVFSVFPGLSNADLDLVRSDFILITRRPVKLVFDGKDATLNWLLCYLDDSEAIHVSFDLTVEVDPPIATAHLRADVHLGLDVGITRFRGGQGIRLTPRVLNPKTAVLERSVDVAWWAYVLGVAAVGAGALGVGLYDIIYEHGFAAKVADLLEDAAPPPSLSSLPSEVRLSVDDVSLFQASSERRPLSNILTLGMHDAVIRLRATPLPSALTVDCVTPDQVDKDARIDGIGGVLDDGTRWAVQIDTAIDMLRSGQYSFTTTAPSNGTGAVIEVVAGADPPYLRTKGDAGSPNNLGALPNCSKKGDRTFLEIIVDP